jgi:hypothetical protein
LAIVSLLGSGWLLAVCIGPCRVSKRPDAPGDFIIYDAKGWIMQAPVSSGQKGRETPAGIFSVLQKEAEHYSNMYDDAHMPHMQRLTRSGIALHGTGIFYGGIANPREHFPS